MKSGFFVVALAFLFMLPAVQAGGGGVQSGENTPCLDFLLFGFVPGVFSPLNTQISTTPGRAFAVSTDAGQDPFGGNPFVHIEFYDASGTYITGNAGAPSGIVPQGGVQAIACVNPPVGMLYFPNSHWFYKECPALPCSF